MDIIMMAVVLGLTSGFCPITVVFLLPFILNVNNERMRRLTINFAFFTFGVLVIIVTASFVLSRFPNFFIGGMS